MYVVRGLAAVSVDSVVFCNVWNPHATQRIRLLYLRVGTKGGSSSRTVGILRSTSRGTVGSTVTPDIDHHSERAIGPASGFLLDLGDFTVDPLTSGTPLRGEEMINFAGWAFIFDARTQGLAIPPSTGIQCSYIAGSQGGGPFECTAVVGEDL